MRAPVADAANNWVEVEKHEEKKIVAEVGKETFEVEINARRHMTNHQRRRLILLIHFRQRQIKINRVLSQ